MKTFGYIYETTDTRNGMFYIGKRVKEVFDEKYHGSGLVVLRIINKYGNDVFITRKIDSADNKEILDSIERAYICAYRMFYGKSRLYNILDGGTGGSIPGRKLSKEHIEKIRLSHLGKKRGAYSEQARVNMRNAHLGVPLSEKHRNAIKKHHLEHPYKHTLETKQKISMLQKGVKDKPQSKEHIAKRVLAITGRRHTPETIKRMSEAQKLRFSK